MLSMEVDVVQYDCPYIDTSEAHEITYFTKQWDFNAADEVLETRIMATGATRDELDRGLESLRDHEQMQSYNLLRRKGEKALIRSYIGETAAMEAIRRNNGYITGPFEIRNGSEMWRVGFDSEEVATQALEDLDEHNDYSIESRESVNLEDYYDVLQNIEVTTDYLDGCRDLSRVERETLATAVREGYFTRPREANLGSLAEEFDISKTAVSKNLRRAQRKILERVVDTIDAVEETDPVDGPTR